MNEGFLDMLLRHLDFVAIVLIVLAVLKHSPPALFLHLAALTQP